MSSTTNPRHVLGISGGKDSAALAIYLRDRVPQMEYFFTDTGKELPETYDYLARLEAYLNKPIARLNAERGFDHWLKIYGGYLPSSRMRWCTKQLKIRPFEEWVGEEEVVSYVGIRADEARDGYVSTKPNIKAVFPFKEDGIIKEDVFRILEESGVGIPEYYKWRSRSGCFFCFFQRRAEWVGLKERHPDLYEQAKKYERPAKEGEPAFAWSPHETLAELEQPARMREIKRNNELAIERKSGSKRNARLVEVFAAVQDDEDDDVGCLVCHL
jgi:3'-phosphoadenosine 5'-phosphosulfate sulfotransferase (PAPS reductase)/FAD synthetase